MFRADFIPSNVSHLLLSGTCVVVLTQIWNLALLRQNTEGHRGPYLEVEWSHTS